MGGVRDGFAPLLDIAPVRCQPECLERPPQLPLRQARGEIY